MRIISGKWKGRKLAGFSAPHVRPTTDRVKESLFNILMGQVEGARVLDLFCGTGNLGLEALSRGAAHVDFVDLSKQSLQVLAKNLELVGASRAEFSIHREEVEKFLKRAAEPYDLIFVDPPFTQKMAHQVMEWMSKSAAFGPSSLLSIESSKHESLGDDYGSIRRYKLRPFGDKSLSFFRREESEA